ncbi:hypothetical protein [uncultured Algibacter sp.]|uniref:hypothetical protein n=1 Tax=uncultured Algibacter sp. TaxID=298659 RepID=UPI002620A102|nr:hypothetical protein [uncultured Algibacter sp.]
MQRDTILDINNDTVFKHIREKFVFSDIDFIPTIDFENKHELKEIRYSDWLDNDHLIILTIEYKKPSTFLIFNTRHQQIVDTIILTELFETCGGYISGHNIHGLSTYKDYFLFSCSSSSSSSSSGMYKLLGYDLNERKIYNIENFIEDKDIVYKKTGEYLHNDGRKHAFLPDIISTYGKFSFTNNNGFEIKSSTTNYAEKNSFDDYYTTIKFPSLQNMIQKTNGFDPPVIKSEKMSKDEMNKHLYPSSHYDRLPLKLKNKKIYNTPRKNAMFGASDIIVDNESPYLFLPFAYYLNPKTFTQKFTIEKGKQYTSVSSKSNDKRARYTGLLVNNKETNELKSVFVHGVGVQGFYKRKGNFIITSIYSDTRENHLVVWDIQKFKPIARLNMEQNTNHISEIFFDEKNKQIIGIHSYFAKIFVWKYYPE